MERRKSHTTFKKLQFKYMSWTLFLSFLIALFSAGVVYFLISTFISQFEYRGPGQVQVMEQVIDLGHSINATILVGFLVVFPLIAILTMYMSHRITGPLLRLKDILNSVSKGVYPDSFDIREKDDLGELFGEVNAMLRRLKTNSSARLNVSRESAKVLFELKSEVASLKTHSPDLSKQLVNLEKLVSDLERSFPGF